STDYEYLTILKDAPILTKVTIDYRYLTIIKDVTKEEIDEYLKILKDVPVSDESDKSDKINQINILKKIKWVPIEEQGEDKEKLYLTMATWTKGIRTIEYESGRYIRSPRIKSCVDLIKLGSSQTNSVITKVS
ncbi:3974_t:CDS:2, partial [Gigaspora margarita]